MIIGISGDKGSFSEEAANHYIQKNKLKDCQLAYLISADKVLKSLVSSKIDMGIFPIENSNGGIVYEAVYAMSKYVFKIHDIFEIDVQHCLHIKPKTDLKNIKKITSHPQALKQCRMYLKRKWENIEIEEYSDTAKAARDLGEDKLSDNTAVIAPELCAKLYNLKIAEKGIQDLKFNFTTFIAAKK